jgi:hypothetical protein
MYQLGLKHGPSAVFRVATVFYGVPSMNDILPRVVLTAIFQYSSNLSRRPVAFGRIILHYYWGPQWLNKPANHHRW